MGRGRGSVVWVFKPVFQNLPHSYTWPLENGPIHILDRPKCWPIHILPFGFFYNLLLVVRQILQPIHWIPREQAASKNLWAKNKRIYRDDRKVGPFTYKSRKIGSFIYFLSKKGAQIPGSAEKGGHLAHTSVIGVCVVIRWNMVSFLVSVQMRLKLSCHMWRTKI